MIRSLEAGLGDRLFNDVYISLIISVVVLQRKHVKNMDVLLKYRDRQKTILLLPIIQKKHNTY